MNPNSETFNAGNEIADSQATCEHCHLARTAGARFCPRCGRELTMQTASGPPLKNDRRPESPGDTPPPTQSGSGTSGGSTPAAASAKQMVPPPAPAASKASTACKCGRILPEDSNFCPGCGASVSTDASSGYFLCSNKSGDPSTPVKGDGCVIGKDANCNVVISDDEFVSRRHARLRLEDGLVFLEDLGSSNGTLLRIRRPIIIEAGDEILIGTRMMRLELRP